MEESYMIAMFTHLPGRGEVWVPLTYPPRRMFKQHWKSVQEQYGESHSIRGFRRVSRRDNVVWEVADEDNFLKEVEAWEMLALDTQRHLAGEKL